jgi:hypothetical protein
MTDSTLYIADTSVSTAWSSGWMWRLIQSKSRTV